VRNKEGIIVIIKVNIIRHFVFVKAKQ